MEPYRYFRRPWNESRGDRHDAWGTSVWLFETDHHGVVLRQVEQYALGPVLRYDARVPEDEFGGLSSAPLNLTEFAPFEIEPVQFSEAWLAALQKTTSPRQQQR